MIDLRPGDRVLDVPSEADGAVVYASAFDHLVATDPHAADQVDAAVWLGQSFDIARTVQALGQHLSLAMPGIPSIADDQGEAMPLMIQCLSAAGHALGAFNRDDEECYLRFLRALYGRAGEGLATWAVIEATGDIWAPQWHPGAQSLPSFAADKSQIIARRLDPTSRVAEVSALALFAHLTPVWQANRFIRRTASVAILANWLSRPARSDSLTQDLFD